MQTAVSLKRRRAKTSDARMLLKNRVIRGFRHVVKLFFEEKITPEVLESPTYFYNLVMDYIQKSDIVDTSESNPKLKFLLGIITYLGAKSKYEEFILSFPTDLFSHAELKEMIELVKEYNHINSYKLTAKYRVQMLQDPLSRLGKYYFQQGYENPFWIKIKERVGIVIENEDEFMRKLRVAMDKVGVSQ